MQQTDMLSGLGVKSPNRIDDIFTPPPPKAQSTANTALAVVTMGGEVG